MGVAIHQHWNHVEDLLKDLPHLDGSRTWGHVVLHHTYDPSHATFAGEKTIGGMIRYWRQRQKKEGWHDPIAYHFLVAPEGLIFQLADLDDVLNASSNEAMNHHGVAVCAVGNFDTGHDALVDPQRHAVVGLCAGLLHWRNIPIQEMHFHREFNHGKSCPGTSLAEGPVKMEIERARAWARQFLPVRGLAHT